MSQKPPRLTLASGKERPLLQGHQWIYSGAIASASAPIADGGLVEIYAASQERLGLAFFNEGQSIRAHMIARGEESLETALRRRLREAASLRKSLFASQETNAIRLFHAEGDGIAGLIVDSYDGVLVVQVSHPGLEQIKPFLLSLLIEEFQPRSLYEKSTSYLRKKEGMQEVRAHLYGVPCPQVEVRENGLRFEVDILQGQKTGFFIDQREMRSLVRSHSCGRVVLNAFAYTGGFSVAALAGGAKQVDSVEISARCKAPLMANLALNGLAPEKHAFYPMDVLQFLRREEWPYDLVILDPPAFAKKRADVPRAFRAYKEMNRRTMEKMKSDALLLSCSCSYHIEESLFQNLLFRAALEAKRDVQILSRHRQALDHPISLFHPETSYLKSFLLRVK